MNELFSSVYHQVSGLGASALLGTILTLTAVFPAAAQQPPEQTTRELTLDAGSLTHLHSRMGGGQLVVEGVDGATAIVVSANIFYYDEADISLSLESINDEARLEAGFIGGDYSGVAPYMDVTIRVPKHFSVDVRHGDGDIQVHNLDAMLTLESGVGDIDVNNVAGVYIEHRSGGRVSTKNIHGPVRLRQR